MIDHYTWSGGAEAMLRFGPDQGPVVVAAMPLLEEANRTRAFVVTMLRRLAQLGIACALPDVPGQGESLVPLETLSILQMQEAFAAAVAHVAANRSCYALSVRSGALLDALSPLSGRWHMAPQDGPDLLRELARIKGIKPSNAEPTDLWWFADGADWAEDADPPVEIAGSLISTDLMTELTARSRLAHDGDSDTPVRVVRLEGDPRPADVHFAGTPLWRRAEPDNDRSLAALLADDIADWIQACEG